MGNKPSSSPGNVPLSSNATLDGTPDSDLEAVELLVPPNPTIDLLESQNPNPDAEAVEPTGPEDRRVSYGSTDDIDVGIAPSDVDHHILTSVDSCDKKANCGTMEQIEAGGLRISSEIENKSESHNELALPAPSKFIRQSSEPVPPPAPSLYMNTESDLHGSISPSQPTALYRGISDPVTETEKMQVMTKEKSQSINNRMLPSFSIKRLIRQLSSSSSLPGSGRTFRETVYCKICMENCPTGDMFATPSCTMSHRVCKDCLKGYLESQIDSGIIEHKCLLHFEDDCMGIFSIGEMEKLVCAESFQKLERFTLVKTLPNYRECPSCNHGCNAEVGDTDPNITCIGCGLVYCFHHSNAHPGRSCSEYVRQLGRTHRRELRAGEQLVRASTRPCPSCGAATEKVKKKRT